MWLKDLIRIYFGYGGKYPLVGFIIFILFAMLPIPALFWMLILKAPECEYCQNNLIMQKKFMARKDLTP